MTFLREKTRERLASLYISEDVIAPETETLARSSRMRGRPLDSFSRDEISLLSNIRIHEEIALRAILPRLPFPRLLLPPRGSRPRWILGRLINRHASLSRSPSSVPGERPLGLSPSPLFLKTSRTIENVSVKNEADLVIHPPPPPLPISYPSTYI